MKSHKILDISHKGVHIECIYIDKAGEANPYRLRKYTHDGFRLYRKQVAKYGDFQSILWFISQHHEWFGYD